MTLRTPMLALLALAGLAGSLRAEVSVSLSPKKPDGKTIFAYEASEMAGNSTAFSRGTGEFRNLGQSFIAEGDSVLLKTVTFKIWNSDPQVEGKKFSLRIYRLKAVGKAPDPGDDLLSSQNGQLPEVINPKEYISFSLGEPVKLEGGGAYLVLFAFEEPTSQDGSAKSLGLERSDEGSGLGRLWIDNGQNFISDNKTLTLFLQGE